MNRRIALKATGLAALAGLSLPVLAQTAAAPKGGYRLVVQMSDGDTAKWNLALNNIRNVQDDVGAANVQVELVAYGPGIGMLKFDAPTNSRITEAMKAGVKVVACENTLRNMKLTAADMHPAISYVPAGVTEIMRKQAEGWAYVRP